MRKSVIVLLFMVLLISACSGSTEGVLSKITKPAAPEQGKATAVGQIYDTKTGKPMADVVVRLAEVVPEKEVFVLNLYSSPGARTDAQGIYIFENIEPGQYVMSVGEGENINDYDVIEESATGRAKVWSATADTISDWGVSKAEIKFR